MPVAVNGSGTTTFTDRLRGSFLYLPSSPQSDQISLDIRAALWQAGKGRSAVVIDVAIAAIATQAAAPV